MPKARSSPRNFSSQTGLTAEERMQQMASGHAQKNKESLQDQHDRLRDLQSGAVLDDKGNLRMDGELIPSGSLPRRFEEDLRADLEEQAKKAAAAEEAKKAAPDPDEAEPVPEEDDGLVIDIDLDDNERSVLDETKELLGISENKEEKALEPLDQLRVDLAEKDLGMELLLDQTKLLGGKIRVPSFNLPRVIGVGEILVHPGWDDRDGHRDVSVAFSNKDVSFGWAMTDKHEVTITGGDFWLAWGSPVSVADTAITINADQEYITVEYTWATQTLAIVNSGTTKPTPDDTKYRRPILRMAKGNFSSSVDKVLWRGGDIHLPGNWGDV